MNSAGLINIPETFYDVIKAGNILIFFKLQIFFAF